MKRGGSNYTLEATTMAFPPLSRLRLLQILMCVAFLYLLLISFEIPVVFRTRSGSGQTDGPPRLIRDSPPRHSMMVKRRMREFKKVSGLVFDSSVFAYDRNNGSKSEFSELHKAVKNAWEVGNKLWERIESGKIEMEKKTSKEDDTKNRSQSCPHSISLPGTKFRDQYRVLEIPCGMTLWSHITLVGTPRWAHKEYNPKISALKEGEEAVMVSQFMLELQGLKSVDGEEPPRILHLNPRLKGDWSEKPVIEHNTCYRMQWGSALRCEGWKSRADEETG